MTAARRAARAAVVAIAAWSSTPAAALAGVPEGIAWLRTQANADGSFGGQAASLATPHQSTAEVLASYQVLGREDEPPFAAALAFVGTGSQANSESLARRILVSARAGLDVSALVDELRQRQGPDGGFGEQPGYEGSVLDTALALEALAAVPDAPGVQAALSFLVGRQRPDGGFSDGANEASVYLTALALRPLSLHRLARPDAETAAQGAVSFLLAARSGDGWGETHLTALALVAVALNLVDLAPVSVELAALAAGQLADGSWEEDAYTTALALRALHLASLPRRDPRLGSLSGRVVDAQTDLPLAGVAVVLSGPVAGAGDTGPDGAFAFHDLPPGGYGLELSRADYAPLALTLATQAGADGDLGVLRLSKQATATTGTVRGIVSDALSGLPLAGATVSVAGGPSATSDAAGAYQINDVVPGAIVVEAQKDGYASLGGSGHLSAGAVLLFSPALTPGDNNPTATLVGVASRASDGAPLAGVAISVTGASTAAAVTDASGSYAITGLGPGIVQLRASLAGFDDVSGAAEIVGSSTVSFSPRMHATGTTPDGGSPRVSGRVVDAGTGEPIRGALVSSSGGDSVVTGADGRFSVLRTGAGSEAIAIFSTGVAAAGVPLANGSIDPHWQIVAGTTSFPGPNAYVARYPAWIENRATSKWISPDPNPGQNFGVASFVYRTTFDLDGLDPATASLSFLLATDNQNLQVLLNGVDTGLPPNCNDPANDFSCFSTLRAFSLPPGSGFRSGTNTLDFVVLNGGGPAGLLVDIAGTAEPLSDPALELRFSAPGYAGGELALNWGLAGVNDVGDVRLVPEGAAVLLPDLSPSRLDRSGLVSDPQSLAVTGAVTVFVANTGNAETQAEADVVVFEDRDGDGRFDAAVDEQLGSATLPAGIGVGEAPLAIPVSGTVSFRDGLLHVTVDAGQAVAESDEDNNTAPFEPCTSARLPFIDNFNDGDADGWQPLIGRGSTPATVIAGEYVRPGNGASYTGSTEWTDYRAEIKLRLPNGHSNDAGLAFRARNPNDFYSLRIQSGLVRLMRFTSGAVAVLASGPITLLNDPQRYHTIRADVAGKWVRTYLNNELIFEYDGLDWEKGAVGTEQDGVLVHYDDLRVTPLTVVEDFDDGDAVGWRPLSYGSTPATVVNGEYVRNGSGSSAFGSTSWKNYTAEVRVRFPSGPSNDGALVFLARDSNSWAHLSINGGLIRLAISGLGAVRSANVVLPDPTGWQTIKAEVRGRTVRCFINGQFVFDYDQLPWENGAVGTVQDNVLVHYDDLKISFAEAPGAADLSASRLVIEDLGFTARLTVRAGTGGGSVAAGLPVAFYDGDPGAGGVLLGTAVTTGSLSAGQFEDVSLELARPLAGLSEIVAVVDDDGTGQGQVAECDEANNRLSQPIAAVPGVFSLQLMTDQPSYGPNTDVRATATLQNLGSLSRTVAVRFLIETADGSVPLAELPQTAPVLVLPGTPLPVQALWNTGTTLTGSYRVRAELVAPGVTLGATAPFAVVSESGAVASARLTTDKASYLPSETVQLRAQALNASANTPLADLRVTTTVRRPNSTVRFTQSETLAQLVPGARREYAYGLPIAFDVAGLYSASLSVETSAGLELASATTSFAVQSTAGTGAGLAGTLVASPRPVPQGESVSLSVTVTNHGNSALAGLPIVVRVVDPEADTVVAEFARSLDLAQGASESFSESWPSQGPVGATYVAVVSAAAGGTSQALAHDTITIAEPPPILLVTGSLAVAPELVAQGDDVVIHETVRNEGNVVVSSEPFTLQVVEVASGLVVAEWTDTESLDPGEEFQALRSFRADAPQGSAFDVVLLAPGVAAGELARARFTVVAPPVRLDVHQELAHEARVLAYVDCGGHDKRGHDKRHHERDRGRGRRCAAGDKLEALLDDLGARHLVTQDEWRFLEELRSGRYNVYVVTGRMCHGAGDVTAELREAVRRGDGLLVDGSFEDESDLDEMTGADRDGRLRFSRIEMRVDGPLYAPARLDLVGDAWRLDPTTGAVQASLPGQLCRRDDDDDDDDDDRRDDDDRDGHRKDKHRGHRKTPRDEAAIVSNAYGGGHVLTLAFDLLASYSRAEHTEREAWQRLLLESLAYLTPEPKTEVGPLGYAVLTTEVANVGAAAVDVELAFTLAEGLRAEDTEPEAEQDGSGVLHVRLSLAPDDTRAVRLGLRAPRESGRYVVDTVFSTCVATSCSDDGTRSFALDVVPALARADDVIVQLRGLPLSRSSDRAARDQAVKWIERARKDASRRDYDDAIKELLKAADSLARIRGTLVSPQQLAVARMLGEAGRRWWRERR